MQAEYYSFQLYIFGAYLLFRQGLNQVPGNSIPTEDKYGNYQKNSEPSSRISTSGVKNTGHRINIRTLMGVGYLLTIPSVIFWLLVLYTRIFHNHKYIDTLLSGGGIFLDIMIKGFFPFASLIIAVICNKVLREDAMEHNVWHSQTNMMRVNQRLINWNAILLLAMIFSLINN